MDGISVTLNGTAPLSVYQTLLQSLRYGLIPTQEPPCPLDREIQVTVYGGG